MLALSVACATSSVFDVRSYGAVGDGVKDDTVAVRRAAKALAALQVLGGSTDVVRIGGRVRVVDASNQDGRDQGQGTVVEVSKGCNQSREPKPALM